jgi:putative ABC transport system permease protein
MRTIDLLVAALGVFAHRVRAALTLLGVVIGTSSIVLLASLLHGGERFLVAANQDASDDDVVQVHAEEPPAAERDRTTRALSRTDASELARAASLEGARVAPESSRDELARHAGRRKRVAVVSAGPVTLALYRLAVARGRALDADDARAGRRVCVIGHEVYEQLAPGEPLADLHLEIDGQLFSVVGVLAHKPMLGATDSTHLWDRKVMIPETTYDALYAQGHAVTRIYVRRPGPHGPTRAAVRSVVGRRHLGVMNFALGKDESGGMETLILTIIRVLLLGTGVLALLASGINIMNVMLVTVTERTREIGLRRAIGATRRSILVQFVLEAVALALLGAVVGVVVGIGVAYATALLARSAIGAWEMSIRPWSVALGVGLALVTGLGFGLLPAWRASRILPIVALRSD